MKFKIILTAFAVVLFSSCGSTEQVITSDGSVYEVKGSKIYKNDVNVTETLSVAERSNVLNTLEDRLALEKKVEKEREKLEKEQERLEKAKEEAQKKQEQLEKEIEERSRAREKYLDAKKDLSDERETYERRLKKGKLSPNDISDWESKLKNLETKVLNLERDYNRLN